MAMSPGGILDKVLMERRKANSRYTLRAMARDTKLSPSFLSLLIQGRRGLSVKRAITIADRLDLPRSRRKVFLKSVAMSGIDPGLRKYVGSLLLSGEADDEYLNGFFKADLDRVLLLAEWYNIAVLELMTCAGARSDRGWIASRLGITGEQAARAFATLCRMGLLERAGGRWVKKHALMVVPTVRSERAVRDYHRQNMELAVRHHETRQSQLDFQRRKITSATIAVDPTKIQKARALIDEFRNGLMELLTEGDSSEVYQLNIQFFPLTLSGDDS